MNREKLDPKESFEALLQSVTDYVVAINRNFEIIIANDLFKNEFGFRPEGFCYKKWKDRNEKCEECPVERSFLDGESHTTEQTVVMKDGRTAQMLIKSTPVRNNRGKIAYVLETATDITEKKQLQNELNRIAGDLEGVLAERLRELQSSEKKYRTIFERSKDAILLTDSKGRILEINQAGIEMLGYKRKDEILSVTTAQALFEKEEELLVFQKMLFKEGFVPGFETSLKSSRGVVFNGLITANVILDLIGQITGYVMIIMDITKLKESQAQIERRNVRLATLNAISMTLSGSLDLNEVLERTTDKMLEILESDSVRIYLLDSTKKFLTLMAHKGLSKRFAEAPGIKRRELGDGLLGDVVTSGEIRVVDNLSRPRDPYVSLLFEEGLKSSAYIPLVSKGKTVGAMVVSSHSTFRFSDQYVEFLSAIGNQIGVALENAELYRDLKIAYQELKEAQEQLIAAEKLASLGKLSATIAHEINNPIATVLTYIGLLMKMGRKNRFTQDRAEDILKYLTIMESETSRCGEIVKNLLDFSRQSRMSIESHQIKEIIEKTLALIAHDLEMKEIDLDKDIAPDLPDIKCDFRQMQQALLNLLGNASESMPRGGTLLIKSNLSDNQDHIEVVIADKGGGIPHEDLQHIFEPFFTTKEEGKGVGLGLSVVYGIVTRHNGTIKAESTPGEGSAFTISLPVA